MAIGETVAEATVTTAMQPPPAPGGSPTVDGGWIRWTSPANDAGAQFDVFASQHSDPSLAAWTINASRHRRRAANARGSLAPRRRP
jgi:hypothetical protein